MDRMICGGYWKEGDHDGGSNAILGRVGFYFGSRAVLRLHFPYHVTAASSNIRSRYLKLITSG